jgi:hypothetical protein
MTKIKDSYDEELERRDNQEYANRVIGNKTFLRDNPEHLKIELQKRILHSQTPKWVNYLMLIIVALTFGISIWALLHSYSII